jgi:ferrous iron transport protein B
MGNTEIGGATLMSRMAGGLDGFGRFLGLDGVILTAFVLAIPANEIIIPTILMGYAQAPAMVEFEQFEGLRAYFDGQGWTLLTALSLLIFVVLHHPCSTTLLTIKHETGSWGWTAAAFVIPLGTGLAVLAAFASVWRLVGGG